MMFQKKIDPITNVLHELFKNSSIRINKSTIEEKLLQHPDYPSLFSITNTLSNFGIPNKAVRISNEQLEQLETPFLATTHFDETILVKSMENSTITYYTPTSGFQKSSVSRFLGIWNNMVVLLDNKAVVEEKKYNQEKSYGKLLRLRPFVTLSLVFCMLLLVALAVGFGMQLIFILVKLCGLVVSFLLVAKELNSDREYGFCKAGKKIDCNEVLNSPAAKIFSWLSITDMGLLYFSGTLLALVISSLVHTEVSDTLVFIILLLSFLSLPYTIYSLAYQAFKIKKWCTLCLAVIAVLWVEAIFGYYQVIDPPLSENLEIQGVLLLLVCLLIPAIIWMYLKNILVKANSFDALRYSFLRITNNIQVFQLLQQKEKEVDMDLQPFEVVLGNDNAQNVLVLALNPFCPACGREYEAVAELLNKQPDFAKVVIRFVGSLNHRDDAKNFISSLLIGQYKNRHQDFKDLLGEWFATNDRNAFVEKYELKVSDDIINTLKHHYFWSEKLRINVTPTAYLNGKKLSEKYTINSLNSVLSMNH